MSILLGVNVDHVATLRQARLTDYPDPLDAVFLAEKGGADGITIHLREDRRHIQDHDVLRIQAELKTRLNLEMAVTEEMLRIAEKIKPVYCCLVPEKREELTTEGGLEIAGQIEKIQAAVARLTEAGIKTSLFIDPDEKQIDAAAEAGAPYIELHTGCYADAKSEDARRHELTRMIYAAKYADQKGLVVNAGHGLNLDNVSDIAAIPQIYELNIGHAIVARAVFVGMEQAVREMKLKMLEARGA